MSDNEAKSIDALKAGKFSSAGDWINQLMDKHYTTEIPGTPAEKDADGKVTKRATKGKREFDIEGATAWAEENGLTVKTYPNPGMYRMNIGNMLRAAAKRRHGLMRDGKFRKAPDDFPVNEEKTEKPDGTKIAKAKPKKEAEAA